MLKTYRHSSYIWIILCTQRLHPKTQITEIDITRIKNAYHGISHECVILVGSQQDAFFSGDKVASSIKRDFSLAEVVLPFPNALANCPWCPFRLFSKHSEKLCVYAWHKPIPIKNVYFHKWQSKFPALHIFISFFLTRMNSSKFKI